MFILPCRYIMFLKRSTLDGNSREHVSELAKSIPQTRTSLGSRCSRHERVRSRRADQRRRRAYARQRQHLSLIPPTFCPSERTLSEEGVKAFAGGDRVHHPRYDDRDDRRPRQRQRDLFLIDPRVVSRLSAEFLILVPVVRPILRV